MAWSASSSLATNFPGMAFLSLSPWQKEYLDNTTVFQIVVAVWNEGHSATSLVSSVCVWPHSNLPRNTILEFLFSLNDKSGGLMQ